MHLVAFWLAARQFSTRRILPEISLIFRAYHRLPRHFAILGSRRLASFVQPHRLDALGIVLAVGVFGVVSVACVLGKRSSTT